MSVPGAIRPVIPTGVIASFSILAIPVPRHLSRGTRASYCCSRLAASTLFWKYTPGLIRLLRMSQLQSARADSPGLLTLYLVGKCKFCDLVSVLLVSFDFTDSLLVEWSCLWPAVDGEVSRVELSPGVG
jgi:hypothetical protein